MLCAFRRFCMTCLHANLVIAAVSCTKGICENGKSCLGNLCWPYLLGWQSYWYVITISLHHFLKNFTLFLSKWLCTHFLGTMLLLNRTSIFSYTYFKTKTCSRILVLIWHISYRAKKWWAGSCWWSWLYSSPKLLWQSGTVRVIFFFMFI